MGNSQAQNQVADLNEENQQHNQYEGEEHEAGAQNQYDFQYTEKDLEYVGQKEKDEAYGEIKIYHIRREAEQEEEELEICTKTKIFDSKDDCKEYHNDLQSKKDLNHPNLVKLVKAQAIMNSNFCTNIYKIDMAYEYFQNNLKTEILNRYESKEYFDEATIFDLIEQVMSCLQYLQTQGIEHGDIQPKTILIDSYGNFKITDIRFLTAGMCGYKKHLLGLETECFLAPELLQKLRRQTILDSEEVDQERADIFSLGLVALAMGTLQNVDGIYDFEDYTLKEEEILDLLEIIKGQYSNNLYLLLVSMLNQVDKRINYLDGYNLIVQMRDGQFDLEEYEQKRFQSELEQSEKKLAQSGHQHQNYPQSPSNQNKNEHHIPINNQQYSRQSSQQHQGEFTNTSAASENRILDFDPDREARKKSKKQNQPQQNQQQDQYQQDNYNNNNNNYNNQKGSPKNASYSMNDSNNHPNNYSQSHQSSFESSNHKGGSNSEIKRSSKPVNSGNNPSQTQIHGHQQSDQKNDRYDNHHQFNHHSQNSHSKIGGHSQQYQNFNHSNMNSNHNQTNINDIDSRVRDALLRSQQVSLKFENSPLRLFRDQLLADELYVPLDPQFTTSSHFKARQLEGSARKNQLSQSHSHKINYSHNASQNFSAQKTTKKNDSTQKLVQKKWKI